MNCGRTTAQNVHTSLKTICDLKKRKDVEFDMSWISSGFEELVEIDCVQFNAHRYDSDVHSLKLQHRPLGRSLNHR